MKVLTKSVAMLLTIILLAGIFTFAPIFTGNISTAHASGLVDPNATPPIDYEELNTPPYMYYAKTNVYAYDGPSYDSQVLYQLDEFAMYYMLDVDENGWGIIVGVNGDFAYTHFDNLVKIEEEKDLPAKIVTASKLNLRDNNSTKAEVITQLPKGAKVYVMGKTDDWSLVLVVSFDKSVVYTYNYDEYIDLLADLTDAYDVEIALIRDQLASSSFDFGYVYSKYLK